MSKLEEKLIELGYDIENTDWTYKQATKAYMDCCIIIYFNKEKYGNNITFKCVKPIFSIKSQQDIDNLQQAFNVLQKDLEVLKEYEVN